MLKRIPKLLVFLVEGNPWKQNGNKLWLLYDPRSYEKLKKRVTDKYFEKSSTLNTHHLPLKEKYVTITVVEWLVSIYMAYLFDRNSEGKTSQIEWLFESNLRSFAYSKCSTAAKAALLTRAARFRPILSPDAQNRGICELRKLHSNSRYGPDLKGK